MLYLLLPMILGIAIVAVILGAWWAGLVVLVIGLLALAYVATARRKDPSIGTIETARKEPTGTPRSSSAGAETANERVGQD